MNLIKIGSTVNRFIKLSVGDITIRSSYQCTCIQRESLHTKNTLFLSHDSETKSRESKSDTSEYRRMNFGKVIPKNISNSASITDSVEYKVKGDPDVFGDYGDRNTFEDISGDEGDAIEETFLENPPSPEAKLRTKQYADMIKKCISEKRFGDAFDVLETRMLKQDRVKPEVYIYNLLISACGRWGYTKKAFQLFNQMKERGLKPKPSTYTSLFNACSNSPWPEDGLKRAKYLREFMLQRKIEMNNSHYHTMIKAFGRCGNLKSAFEIVDEMITNSRRLTSRTFNLLLQACISDQEAGFRHSLLVWRKMLQKNVKPDLFTYNLMLRSVRDCGIGDTVVAQNVLEQITQSIDNPSLPKNKSALLIESKDHVQENTQSEVFGIPLQSESNENSGIAPSIADSMENRPNLLAVQPHLGTIVQMSEITKPHERLLLLGGCTGFLQSIVSNDLSPDIKTFTLLLDCLSPTLSAENFLLSTMKKQGVVCDIDFFNMLIKKRSMRFDYRNAKDVLRLIQQARLYPDIITFGVLALGCRNEVEAKELCWDMREAGYRMNVEILGAMLKQACIQHNFHYVWKIVNIAKEENIRPNAQFLKHLENLDNSCQELLKSKDKTDLPEYVKSKNFVKEARKFMYRYKAWLKGTDPEEEIHPWEQFRKKQPEDKREPAFARGKN